MPICGIIASGVFRGGVYAHGHGVRQFPSSFGSDLSCGLRAGIAVCTGVIARRSPRGGVAEAASAAVAVGIRSKPVIVTVKVGVAIVKRVTLEGVRMAAIKQAAASMKAPGKGAPL